MNSGLFCLFFCLLLFGLYCRSLVRIVRGVLPATGVIEGSLLVAEQQQQSTALRLAAELDQAVPRLGPLAPVVAAEHSGADVRPSLRAALPRRRRGTTGETGAGDVMDGAYAGDGPHLFALSFPPPGWRQLDTRDDLTLESFHAGVLEIPLVSWRKLFSGSLRIYYICMYIPRRTLKNPEAILEESLGYL